MNFDFYIFQKEDKNYYQYIDDSTKDIFQSINIKSKEQLSIFHDDSLVYYIYTEQRVNGYIGFCIIFNGIIFTDLNVIYNLFKTIKSKCNELRTKYVNKIDISIPLTKKQVKIWTNEIEITLELHKDKFVECGKPTYNLINDKDNNEKIFDTSGISTNKHLKIRGITKAIKQYQWVYILREEDIIKTTSDVKSNVKNNKKSRVVDDIIVVSWLIISFWWLLWLLWLLLKDWWLLWFY